MNKKIIIPAAGFFLVAGMALARPGGFGGGFSGGGHDGGGWNNGGGNNGGNSNTSSSTDNTDDYHGRSGGHSDAGRTSSAHPSFRNGGGWSQGNSTHSYHRSGSYSNYRSHNGWNRPSQGFHHFNRFNNYGNTQTNRNYHGLNNGFGHHFTIPQNLRNMGITHLPHPLTARASLPSGFQHHAPSLPGHGPAGRSFSSPALSPRQMTSSSVRTQMAAIAGNHNFMAKVAATTPTAGMRNHYYWHTWNGYNYCTYYDGYGCAWYGWNCGAGFFWTQYYCGNWWWYDPWWGNWCWWSNGGWWWQDPATTTVYIYNNGDYTPTDSNANYENNSPSANTDDYGGPVYGDDGQKPSDDGSVEPNQSANNEHASVDFLSQDGKVKVTVSAEGDAFLYKMKNSKPSGKPIFLDSNVDQVKFSGPGDGPARILLIFKDGTFTTFNANGSPSSGAKT